MMPRTVGMDFSEVNFQLSSDMARRNDEQSFRELFELIVDTVNQPEHNVHFSNYSNLKHTSNQAFMRPFFSKQRKT